MAQLETPSSKLRNSIPSPLVGGMMTTQSEQAFQRTPQMTTFNPSRRRLQTLKTPNSHNFKSEVVADGDEVAASRSTPTAILPKLSTDEGSEGEKEKTTVTVPVDNVQEGLLKPADYIYPPSHENISRLGQYGGTPKRFLKTIEKRRQLRREKRNASKLAASHPVEQTTNTLSHIEKDHQRSTLPSHDSRGVAEIDSHHKKVPELFSDEQSDHSQESTSLEEIIGKAPRISISQASNESVTENFSLSFGPPRLVRRADVGSNSQDNDSDHEVDKLDIAILDLAEGSGSSKPIARPDDSGDVAINENPRNSRRSSREKKKKKKKRPRRLPVDELCLVSETLEEPNQEEDDENVQPSAELLDDPISQDASDALQIIRSVGRAKSERKMPEKWSYGAFGKIDTEVYRFPKHYNASPQPKVNNHHGGGPFRPDGFVGDEANPTGQYMVMPKQKRVGVSIWGLTTRVSQLVLVRQKDHGLDYESNCEVERRILAQKSRRPPHKRATPSAPVLIELKSEARETCQAQQDEHNSQGQQDHDNQDNQSMHGYFADDEIVPNVENNSPLPLDRKVSRKVTFDERAEVDRRIRMSSLGSQASEDYPIVERRHDSSESLIWRDMATVRLKRYQSEDREEEAPSANESGHSVVIISTDSDRTEESDDSSHDSNLEQDEEQEKREDSDVQMVSDEDTGSRSDRISIFIEDERSEVGENNNEEMVEEEEVEVERRRYLNVRKIPQDQRNNQIGETRISSGNESIEVSSQSSEKNDSRDYQYGSNEEMVLNERLGGDEEITRAFVLGESLQDKENSPFEDLILKDFQITESVASEENNNTQPSQLSITMSWHNSTNTMNIPEADTWRPRRPRSSNIMNETEEDIFDSPSPVLAISSRRRSAGLQTRRRRTFSSQPLALTTSLPPTPPSPEIPETQFVAIREVSPELGTSQVSDMSDELGNSVPDALTSGSDDALSPHSSQHSFIPEEIVEESYFCRASLSLRGSFQTPKSRAKSTPGHFHPENTHVIMTPAYASRDTEDISSIAGRLEVPLKFSQLSYVPSPRPEQSLSSITRKASFAFGTLPASARRKRAKTLAFIPPFKKAKLGI